MTTQEMYNKGLRCKGRGFNCYGCKDANECVEYINMNVKEKPPLGVTPKYIWDKQRISDLREVIDRYTKVNLQVPVEWVEEYNDLTRLYNNKY